MKTPVRVLVAASLVLAAAPAWSTWELLRGNGEQRLSIDPRTINVKDADTSFSYLLDFRKPQGEPTGQYRSIVVDATLRCKDKSIAMSRYEIYQSPAGGGVMLAMREPTKEEREFRPVEKGSSDEELHQYVCLKKKPAATPAKAAPAAPAKK